MTDDRAATRAALMADHVQARARRDAAPLGSDEYRAACEEVGAIEVRIAAAEEPPAVLPGTSTGT
ncbi:MAG: hypothetical protein KF809_15710 [Chloroflexi bacterium]|nr:hypothetical protein [Chloroflexota bacterium]